MIEKSVQELVSAFQQGSRDAFAQLVLRYQNLVTSVAYSRTGDVQRSEDIAQQAFLIAWEKQSELEHADRFGAWIRGITNNLALNEVRLKANKNRRSASAIDVIGELESTQPVDAETIRNEQNELLWSTLENIPELYREPIVLFYREGQSVASVAEQLELSEDAVKQRLSRGRSMMKKEIEQLVEKMLFETRPQEAFCASVMTMLPAAMGSKLVGIAAAKVGATAGSKTVAAKVATGAASGFAAGMMGALIGLFGGVAGAWIGTRQGIKHATSQEEKDLHYWVFGSSSLLSIAYTLGLLALVTVLRDSTFFTFGMFLANVGFFLTLFAIIVYFVVRQKELHAKYGKPNIYTVGKQKEISSAMLRFNAIGCVIGGWAWIVILMAVAKAWILFAVSLAGFLTFCCWAWLEAPLKKNRVEQTELAGNLCLYSTICEAIIIMCGYFFDLYGKQTSYDNIPFWGLAVIVVLFGAILSSFIKFVGRRQHESANSES